MKLRVITISLAAVLTGCMCSCEAVKQRLSQKLPGDTAISGRSGKSTVSVGVGGLTFSEALKKVGLTLSKVGAKLLADYAAAKLSPKLDQPAANSGK